ncbi:MAG: ligand-binding SRPBCC domain-containing protein, partial [Myxococcota bacterium]
VPGFALNLVLGEAAQMILQSPQALPAKLLSSGFEFNFTSLNGALRDIVHRDTPDISSPLEAPAELPSKPRSALHSSVVLDAPIDEVFPFFSAAENLGLMTPHWMGFRILSGAGESVKAGDLIDYRIKLGPLPMRWRTEITVWDEGTRFVDNQLKGPYSLWWHEHRFTADGDRTIMTDTVYFTVPLGPLGRIAEWLFVRGILRRVFRYRSTVIRRLFGGRSRGRRVRGRKSAAA